MITPLAARRGLITPLARGIQRESAAVSWWLSGGIDAANCIAAYQPKGAASYAASLVNLANPGTYNAYEGSAPSWDSSYGWHATTTSKYLKTDIYGRSDQTWSMFIRFSDDSSQINYAIAGAYNPGYFLLEPKNANDKVAYFNSSGLQVSPGITSGVIGMAGSAAFRNGVKESSAIPKTSDGALTNPILIFRYNLGASRLAKIQAMVIYDTVISDTQAGLLSTAMAAL